MREGALGRRRLRNRKGPWGIGSVREMVKVEDDWLLSRDLTK